MDKVPTQPNPEGQDVPQMSEAEAQAFWRGYAQGFKDACEPDPDRKAAHAAGYLSGVQTNLDEYPTVVDEAGIWNAMNAPYPADRRLPEERVRQALSEPCPKCGFVSADGCPWHKEADTD